MLPSANFLNPWTTFPLGLPRSKDTMYINIVIICANPLNQLMLRRNLYFLPPKPYRSHGRTVMQFGIQAGTQGDRKKRSGDEKRTKWRWKENKVEMRREQSRDDRED